MGVTVCPDLEAVRYKKNCNFENFILPMKMKIQNKKDVENNVKIVKNKENPFRDDILNPSFFCCFMFCLWSCGTDIFVFFWNKNFFGRIITWVFEDTLKICKNVLSDEFQITMECLQNTTLPSILSN